MSGKPRKDQLAGEIGQILQHDAITGNDPRNFAVGWPIPSEHYCDQPYVVKTDDGAWLCALTTGSKEEGNRGQHVISLRSTDQGRSWEESVDVEPSDGPEASYSVLLKVPSGRIYCIYNHNTDNINEVIADDPPYPGGKLKRVDSLGYFVFKYSDDHGRSWSEKRHVIPVREMEIDRSNPYGGEIRFFWNTGYAFNQSGSGYVPLHKVGRFGHGLFVRSEGVLLRSDNIHTETDPEKINWETLPDGDHGLKAPEGGGLVSEEQSFVPLGGQNLFVVFRTINGFPGTAYSKDGGRTWSPPEYATYGPGKRRIKHPRAAGFAWPCENGKFLLWYHNNSTADYNSGPSGGGNRNIAWLSCGELMEDGFIHWSEPEVGVYDDSRLRGASYPNMVEENGNYYFTTTQKHSASTIHLAPRIAAVLFRDKAAPTKIIEEGLVLDLSGDGCANGAAVPAPKLPSLRGKVNHYARAETAEDRGGFSLDLAVRFDSLAPGQILIDTTNEVGQGITLTTVGKGVLRFSMNDGFQGAYWDCDAGLLEVGELHRITLIVDGGPKLISYVIDGVLNDGGPQRPFGYGRFVSVFNAPNGTDTLRIGTNLSGEIAHLRIYDRYLLTGEAVMNHQAKL